MEILLTFAMGVLEFALALATALPTWMYGQPVNVSKFLPVQNATCQLAPEVRKYDITLYQQLRALREQQHKEHYDQIQRVSASVAVFRKRDTAEPEILLLQSKKWQLPWRLWDGGGKWEMTGGGVDMIPHETTLRAAQREAKDEAGIVVSSIDAFVGDHYFRIRLPLIGHNVKIMFIGQVKDGDAGLRNIKLNYFEHERYCWATEKQLAAMAHHDPSGAAPDLIMQGQEAKPRDDQWVRMQYISVEGHQLALHAFEKLREVKAKDT